jgi:hypothetical protein
MITAEIDLNIVVSPETEICLQLKLVDRERESIRLKRMGSSLHVTTTRS